MQQIFIAFFCCGGNKYLLLDDVYFFERWYTDRHPRDDFNTTMHIPLSIGKAKLHNTVGLAIVPEPFEHVSWSMCRAWSNFVFLSALCWSCAAEVNQHDEVKGDPVSYDEAPTSSITELRRAETEGETQGAQGRRELEPAVKRARRTTVRLSGAEWVKCLSRKREKGRMRPTLLRTVFSLV